MTDAVDMFLCDRIPGGLYISEQGCAKQFHKAEKNQKRLAQCIGCETGAALAKKHPDLVWRVEHVNANRTIKGFADIFPAEDRKEEDKEDAYYFREVFAGMEASGWDINQIDACLLYEKEEEEALSSSDPIRLLMESMMFFSVKGLVEAKTEEKRSMHRRWFLYNKKGYVFSCKNICYCIGISHSWLVNAVKNFNSNNGEER